MEVIIQNPTYWYLMWVVLAVAILIIVGLILRRRAMNRFASTPLLKHLAPHVSSRRKGIKALLFVTALAAIVAGLADIRWGRVWTEMPQRGIDIVFALDVSRSMLAEDVSPNRLTRAKEYIRDMMEQMGGDRVGLITFAGKTKQLVPLTSNYNDVNIALDEVSPQSVSRGGSLLGDAIRTAADSFVDKTADHKAIVVITDGEDQESYPIEAAKKAFKEKGIRVYTVGLGDMKTGARIPIRTTSEGKIYLKYNGQEVWSKMDGKILEQTALAGGGAYIPAGTKHADMADVYDQHIRAIQQREFQQARVNRYVPRFQWFLGLAVLLLLADAMIAPNRKPKFLGSLPNYESDEASAKFAPISKQAGHVNKGKPAAKLSNPRVPIVLIVIGLAMVLAVSTPASAGDAKPSELVRQGNAALAAGQADEALAAYKQAQEKAEADGRELPELVYNQAVAMYRKGEYAKAKELLRNSLTESNTDLEAKARFNMGNCEYAAALPLAQKDKKQAMEHLNEAIKHYRDALAIDGNDTDSRANIELAELMIDKLKKEQKQQDKKKQDQQKQQQQQNKNDQQKQNKDQQKKNDKQNQDQKKKDQQDKQQQNKKDQEKQQQNQDKNKKDKKQPNQNKQHKSDEKNKQNQEQNKDQKKQQAQDKDKQQQNQKDKQQKQDKQQNNEKKDKDKQDRQAQPKPSQADQKNQNQPQGKGQAGAQPKQQQTQPEKMSPEEAAKLLQAVRDKNLKRRKEKMQRTRMLEMPVEKDW